MRSSDARPGQPGEAAGAAGERLEAARLPAVTVAALYGASGSGILVRSSSRVGAHGIWQRPCSSEIRKPHVGNRVSDVRRIGGEP